MTREEFYKLTDILNSEVLGNFMHGGEASEVIAQFEEAVEKSCILKEEPVSDIDFEQELYKAFGQVKDFTLGMQIAKRFYEMGKQHQEPVSEDLEEASKNYALNNTPWDDCKDEIQESFKAGAKWQKQKDSIVSEDLEKASKEWLAPQLDKSYANYGEGKMMELTHFDGYAMLDAIEFGANWQEQQMKTYGFEIININRRTLEYIYDVCKGVMPSKELFIKCVMGTIKED